MRFVLEFVYTLKMVAEILIAQAKVALAHNTAECVFQFVVFIRLRLVPAYKQTKRER